MSERTEVAILMGGASSEREVSLVSGRAVMEALDTERFHARAIDVRAVGRLARKAVAAGGQEASGGVTTLARGEAPVQDGSSQLILDLTSGGVKPDIAFIALHGRYGEDGVIQGMLELLGIPYTGSGVLASALAMDKAATKRILESCGISTPQGRQVSRAGLNCEAITRLESGCNYPVIVKPNREGSTIGATVVRSAPDLAPAIEEALRHDVTALIEEFVTGTEITVGVLGTHTLEALPVVEICPRTGFYDYEAKYTAGMTEKIVPARLPEGVTSHAQWMAKQVHKALGCSGMSRVDMIVTADDITVLEVNTIPGLTPTSLLPRAAQAGGISFTDLISRIIDYGLEEGVR